MSQPRRPPPPFPLVVVTGFLGAGKTTLLNRLLRDPSLAETLVLINEFGEIGLDHLLVERVEGDMIVMTSGCLCCSIRGDLIATLEQALKERDNGRGRPFTRVVIETTGLADPAPVLHTIMAHPYLRLRFTLQAVVTLIDALTGERSLDRHIEAVKQAAMADRLVIAKTDLVTDRAALARLRGRLAVLNPGAAFFEAVDRPSMPELFEGVGYDATSRGPDALAWLAAEAVEAVEQTAPHAGHTHHPHHQDSNRHGDVRAFCLRSATPISAQGLSLFCELLQSAHGARVLRLKGLVALAEEPDRPLVLHGVQHVMHPPLRLDAWPDADRTTRLVFILQDLEPAFVEGLWQAAAGEPRLDTADLATVRHNPLAPRAGGLLA